MPYELYVWIMLHVYHDLIHDLEVLCPHQAWQCEALHLAWERSVAFYTAH